MTDLSTITSLIFDSVCLPLGCGGELGFIFPGIIIMAIFVLAMYIMRIGLDGSLAIGSFLVILLATNGFIPAAFNGAVWVVLGVLWGIIIWRIGRG